MIPGEYFLEKGTLELNEGREVRTIQVANSGDRPIQVGSDDHLKTNAALVFDRDQAKGFRLNIPAGTAVRFEPAAQRRAGRTCRRP